jgi:single-strand DNA-binding protein
MATDINTITIIGRLTRDAETRTVGDKTVASFAIASNYYAGKDKGEGVNYVDVEYWTRPEFLQHLKKGKHVAVAGTLRQDRWQDKDGQNRSKIKVLGHEVQLLGGNAATGNQGGQTSTPPADDMPF